MSETLDTSTSAIGGFSALGVKSIRFFPMQPVKQALGRKANALREASVRAIVKADKGGNLHYLKFEHDGNFFALSSRIDSKKGSLDIEVDFISSGMSDVVITSAQAYMCEKKMANKEKSRAARSSRDEAQDDE